MTNETEAVRAVDRYTVGLIDDGENRYLGMSKYTEGGCVLYTDHAALIARLTGEVERLRAALRLIEKNSLKADWPEDIWAAITSALTQPEADQ